MAVGGAGMVAGGFVAQQPVHGASVQTIQHAPGVGAIAATYQPGVVAAHAVAEHQSGFQGGPPEAGDDHQKQ